MAEEANVQGLKELFLFQLMTDEELTDVAAIFKEKLYSSGSRIFSERDRGETMYVVKVGSVKICKRNVDGSVKDLATFSEGDFFGEITLFEYALRTASAISADDTVLLEITRNEFNKFFSEKPHIAAKLLYQMMTEMSRRLRKTNTPATGGLMF